MNICETADAIKKLYKTPNYSFLTPGELDAAWTKALVEFHKSLEDEDNVMVLEKCLLADPNWEISVEERMKLTKKAKLLGASSSAFLTDHYSYLAAHLDPSPEKESALEELSKLLES